MGDLIFGQLQSGEEAALNLSGEDSLFVRYNNGQIRQNTQVLQSEIALLYKRGPKVISTTWSVGPDSKSALQHAENQLSLLREQALHLADSPNVPELSNNGRSEKDFAGRLPSPESLFDEMEEAIRGLDFCGLLASGSQIFATQNSKGQYHWFSKESFFVDYSLYFGERAVKSVYAGTQWSPEALKKNIAKSAEHLELMKKPTVAVSPGRYRVFLESGAVAELMDFISWYGLSQSAFKTGTALFTDLGNKERSLSPQLNIQENFDLGLAPSFNEVGEVSPPKVPLIVDGKLHQWLTSTRTAKEFQLESNYASLGENPRSLEILPGKLKTSEVLEKLGTGLYLANLHYVNSSDQKTARLTGMTRFAAFWVENGKIVGPIDNLRFDESLYEAWGPNLLALTEETADFPSTMTYGARALFGNKLPGMLIEDFSFTL
jgi:predicted Zn-dependent protease